MNKRRSFFGFHIVLLGATLILTVIGIFFIYSSGISTEGDLYSNEYLKQIVWAVLGIVVLFVFSFFDYSQFKLISLYIFVFFLALLVITLIFGKEVNGSRSWLGGDIGIQPSEFAKIATILFFAQYLESLGKKIGQVSYFLLSLCIILIPMGLILLQPDMGTGLVFIPIFLIMTLTAGARLRHILFIVISGVITIFLIVMPHLDQLFYNDITPVLTVLDDIFIQLILFAVFVFIMGISFLGNYFFKKKYFYWISYFSLSGLISICVSIAAGVVLKDYQVMRLISFLNPYIDPKGVGWNIIQSVTAVGSGGFFGKGFLGGTQSHYRYLPQQSTDFIFSIIAEESGFIGGLIVIGLFCVILLRGLRIVSGVNDRYAAYVGAGIIGMIFFHVVINIGMAMGIMPITGIPLFFLSYGGSSLLTALIGIGIILNMSFKKFS